MAAALICIPFMAAPAAGSTARAELSRLAVDAHGGAAGTVPAARAIRPSGALAGTAAGASLGAVTAAASRVIGTVAGWAELTPLLTADNC